MPTKLYPTDILQQAQETLAAWKQVDAAMALGPLNVGEIEANLSKVDPIQMQISSLEAELTGLRNQRDELYIALWDQVKRARAGFKGIYGDPSTGSGQAPSMKSSAAHAAASANVPPARKRNSTKLSHHNGFPSLVGFF